MQFLQTEDYPCCSKPDIILDIPLKEHSCLRVALIRLLVALIRLLVAVILDKDPQMLIPSQIKEEVEVVLVLKVRQDTLQ